MIDSELIDDFVKVTRPMAEEGRYGIALGGSRGKKWSDAHSDYDFRLYIDGPADYDIRLRPAWSAFAGFMAQWQARGIKIDGLWTRTTGSIDAELSLWIAGEGVAQDYGWTIWGYHLPTDIFHQTILEDPHGILAEWKARLATYPPGLKRAVLQRYGSFLSYWRQDSHYRTKVARGDAVFLAGLSAKLTHAVMQMLCALNDVYFPGDGWNLQIAQEFAIVPDRFSERAAAALYPGTADDTFERQYTELASLIDEVSALAAVHS